MCATDDYTPFCVLHVPYVPLSYLPSPSQGLGLGLGVYMAAYDHGVVS